MATMYGDVGTGIADVIQARKANKEQGFYNSLLSYGMEAGGEFDLLLVGICLLNLLCGINY